MNCGTQMEHYFYNARISIFRVNSYSSRRVYYKFWQGFPP